eukprot:Rmarinus@m.16663
MKIRESNEENVSPATPHLLIASKLNQAKRSFRSQFPLDPTAEALYFVGRTTASAPSSSRLNKDDMQSTAVGIVTPDEVYTHLHPLAFDSNPEVASYPVSRYATAKRGPLVDAVTLPVQKRAARQVQEYDQELSRRIGKMADLQERRKSCFEMDLSVAHSSIGPLPRLNISSVFAVVQDTTSLKGPDTPMGRWASTNRRLHREDNEFLLPIRSISKKTISPRALEYFSNFARTHFVFQKHDKPKVLLSDVKKDERSISRNHESRGTGYGTLTLADVQRPPSRSTTISTAESEWEDIRSDVAVFSDDANSTSSGEPIRSSFNQARKASLASLESDVSRVSRTSKSRREHGTDIKVVETPSNFALERTLPRVGRHARMQSDVTFLSKQTSSSNTSDASNLDPINRQLTRMQSQEVPDTTTSAVSFGPPQTSAGQEFSRLQRNRVKEKASTVTECVSKRRATTVSHSLLRMNSEGNLLNPGEMRPRPQVVNFEEEEINEVQCLEPLGTIPTTVAYFPALPSSLLVGASDRSDSKQSSAADIRLTAVVGVGTSPPRTTMSPPKRETLSRRVGIGYGLANPFQAAHPNMFRQRNLIKARQREVARELGFKAPWKERQAGASPVPMTSEELVGNRTFVSNEGGSLAVLPTVTGSVTKDEASEEQLTSTLHENPQVLGPQRISVANEVSPRLGKAFSLPIFPRATSVLGGGNSSSSSDGEGSCISAVELKHTEELLHRRLEDLDSDLESNFDDLTLEGIGDDGNRKRKTGLGRSLEIRGFGFGDSADDESAVCTIKKIARNTSDAEERWKALKRTLVAQKRPSKRMGSEEGEEWTAHKQLDRLGKDDLRDFDEEDTKDPFLLYTLRMKRRELERRRVAPQKPRSRKSLANTKKQLHELENKAKLAKKQLWQNVARNEISKMFSKRMYNIVMQAKKRADELTENTSMLKPRVYADVNVHEMRRGSILMEREALARGLNQHQRNSPTPLAESNAEYDSDSSHGDKDIGSLLMFDSEGTPTLSNNPEVDQVTESVTSPVNTLPVRTPEPQKIEKRNTCTQTEDGESTMDLATHFELLEAATRAVLQDYNNKVSEQSEFMGEKFKKMASAYDTSSARIQEETQKRKEEVQERVGLLEKRLRDPNLAALWDVCRECDGIRLMIRKAVVDQTNSLKNLHREHRELLNTKEQLLAVVKTFSDKKLLAKVAELESELKKVTGALEKQALHNRQYITLGDEISAKIEARARAQRTGKKQARRRKRRTRRTHTSVKLQEGVGMLMWNQGPETSMNSSGKKRKKEKTVKMSDAALTGNVAMTEALARVFSITEKDDDIDAYMALKRIINDELGLDESEDDERRKMQEREKLYKAEKELSDNVAQVHHTVNRMFEFDKAISVDVTCPYCFSLYGRPECLLPCGHTFCSICVNQMSPTIGHYACAECGPVVDVEVSVHNRMLGRIMSCFRSKQQQMKEIIEEINSIREALRLQRELEMGAQFLFNTVASNAFPQDERDDDSDGVY